MKKGKAKRFDMGGYAAGAQGAYADSLARKAKKDKEERIAADMKDAIEGVYPETLLLGAPNVARRGVAAGGKALSNAAKGAAERAVARQSTAEGLPSSAALRRALGENNPKVVTTKGNFEEFAGFRGRHKPLGSPEARNKILREEAKEAGIPLREYLKGRGAARAEGVAPGVHWRDLLAKGGKVKKYNGKEGSEVKKDKPYLGSREKADVKKMEDMQRKSKTPIGDIEPVPGQYDKKYAAGGKVKKMAFGGMSRSKGEMREGLGKYQSQGLPIKRPDMGVPSGYAGPRSGAPSSTPYPKRQPISVSPGIQKGLGEAVRAGMPAPKFAKGGKVKKAEESKKMVKKEVSFFKKKGAPKSMIKHEEKEAKGMKRGGGKVMKFAKGGSIDGCAVRGKTKLKRVTM